MAIRGVEGKRSVPGIEGSVPVLRAAEPRLSMASDSLSISSRDPLVLRKGPSLGGGTRKMILGGLFGAAGAAGIGAWLLDLVGGGGLLASAAAAIGLASLPVWLPFVSLALLAGGAALAYFGHRENVEEEAVRLALPDPPRPAW